MTYRFATRKTGNQTGLEGMVVVPGKRMFRAFRSSSRSSSRHRVLAACLLVLFPKLLMAQVWGPIQLGSGADGFCFDITARNLPTASQQIDLRMYTKIGAIIVQNNQQQVIVDVQTSDASVLDGPRVEPIGTPDNDRWVLGDFSDFAAMEEAPGTWRFVGRIPNGSEPYTPGDNFGEIRVIHAGGVLANTGYPISGDCDNDQPQPPAHSPGPEVAVPILGSPAALTLISLLLALGFVAIGLRRDG